MAGRIRTLKPELLSDERTAGLSDGAWRLFVSMIVLADDYGNLRAQGRLLVSEVWWSSPPADLDIRGLLAELERAELVTIYRVRGQSYASIRGWAKHQIVDRPGKPHVPGPAEADPEAPITPKEVSRTRRATDSRERTTVSDGFATDRDRDLRPGPGPGPSISAAPEGRAAPAAVGSEALLVFPTIRGKRSGDTEWRFTAVEASTLREGYPDLDVLAEARRAWAWVVAKQDRRKTAGGMMPFLVGWLGRTQNRGGARTGIAPAVSSTAAPRANPKAPPPDLCSFHREVTDRPSSDPYGWCALCKKHGGRPRRSGTSEPEPLGVGVGTLPGGGR